jgi:hypothetical protein
MNFGGRALGVFSYHPHRIAKKDHGHSKFTFVTARTILMTKYTPTVVAWPTDVKPFTFRRATRRKILSL